MARWIVALLRMLGIRRRSRRSRPMNHHLSPSTPSGWSGESDRQMHGTGLWHRSLSSSAGQYHSRSQ